MENSPKEKPTLPPSPETNPIQPRKPEIKPQEQVEPDKVVPEIEPFIIPEIKPNTNEPSK